MNKETDKIILDRTNGENFLKLADGSELFNGEVDILAYLYLEYEKVFNLISQSNQDLIEKIRKDIEEKQYQKDRERGEYNELSYNLGYADATNDFLSLLTKYDHKEK